MRPTHVKLILFFVPQMEIIPWDDCDRNVECKVPLRALIYQDIDVIALCFSIDSQFSLQNVETRWLAEMKHFCVNVPTILIGNKKDLRDQQNMNVAASSIENGKTDVFVMFEQGKEMAERIGALYYLECSAKTMDGINLVLPTAGSVALQVRPSFRASITNSSCLHSLQTFQPKRRPKCVLL